MVRHRALQCLVGFFGLACIAGLYPLAGALTHLSTTNISRGDQMILGIYLPLGVFLLIAARNPSEHRSLIAAIGFSTLGHMAVMIVQDIHDGNLRDNWASFLVIVLLSAALILLLPGKQPQARSSSAKAL